MKFLDLSVAQAEGAILAHTHRLPGPDAGSRGPVFKKGRFLSNADVETLAAAGLTSVWAAVLEADDVPEDEAAQALAQPLIGSGVRAASASTGRVNLFSTVRGLVLVDREGVDRINLADARLTFATLPPDQVVEVDAMVATVKIIPFAVPKTVLEASLTAARQPRPVLRVAPFRSRKTALLLTTLPGVKESQMERATRSQRARIETLGSSIDWVERVPHQTGALGAALSSVLEAGAELVLLLGASAMVDEDDVLPSAIRWAGGSVQQVGMPVDPGNLLVLGQAKGAPVIGVPGCARSPKRSGFDAVLERVAADLPVAPRDIQTMGTGGLLSEIPSRPRPRESEATAVPPRVAAIVLAAGRSTRMGPRNKLLERLDGVPMVARVVDNLLSSAVDPVVVVLGHEADRVQAALRGRPVKTLLNPDYIEGLGSSLRAGAEALDEGVDATVVALGDMPFISGAPLESLIAAYDPATPEDICVLVQDGRRGHPVLFGRRYFDELKTARGDVGARSLLKKYADHVREISVKDDAIHIDVDTPAALAAVASRFEWQVNHDIVPTPTTPHKNSGSDG